MLKTKEFINRYLMGIVILVMFLPGVGVGENFNLLLEFITKPFIILSLPEATFFTKQVYLYCLMIIFIVWSRAQRLAINGGKFTLFQDSLPISESSKNKTNVKMILVSNHFLWPIILASYFYIPDDKDILFLAVTNVTFLVLLLFVTQYIMIFNYSITRIGLIVGIGMIFTAQLSSAYSFYQLALSYLLLYLFVLKFLFNVRQSYHHFSLKRNRFFPSLFSHNFYFQILFKSGLTSSLFRIIIIMGIMFGFTLSINYWVDDYKELTPYYIVLETLLAYFISGFYVSFLDQRNTLKPWLITLPIKNSFWITRDIFYIIVLTALVHVVFYLWAISVTEYQTLPGVFLYHLLLLIICYPIRIYVVKQQTFITFVVLFIITSITLFNLT